MAQWNFYNVVDSFSRFAVPFFVMLSGALLMNKEIQLADFLKKRFVRILIPFLFWSIVYSVYNYYKLNIENKMNISTYVLDCFTNGASYHLWYIYMLIGLYLLIPILAKWIQTSSDSSINYFILIWIVFLSIRFFEIPLHKDFTFTIFTGFAGYLVLGYYLANRNIKISNAILIILALIALLSTILFTYITPFRNGVFNGKYYDYLSLNVVLWSSVLFFIIRNINLVSTAIVDKIKFLNQYSFGVYLIHVLVLDTFQLLHLNGASINPVVGTISTVIACYCISFAIIWLLSRNKYIGSLIN